MAERAATNIGVDSPLRVEASARTRSVWSLLEQQSGAATTLGVEAPYVIEASARAAEGWWVRRAAVKRGRTSNTASGVAEPKLTSMAVGVVSLAAA